MHNFNDVFEKIVYKLEKLIMSCQIMNNMPLEINKLARRIRYPTSNIRRIDLYILNSYHSWFKNSSYNKASL